MYYAWNGWWWMLLWLVPTCALIWWALTWGDRWGNRRFGSYASHVRDWDERSVTLAGQNAGQKYRNRGPRNYRRPDERIFDDVNDRLMFDDEVDPSAMDVQVERGAVTLAGTVETRFEKRRAELLAESVPGVLDVDNRLKLGKVDHTAPPSP